MNGLLKKIVIFVTTIQLRKKIKLFNRVHYFFALKNNQNKQ